MFETSVVHAQARSRSRASILTASLFAHSAVIVGAIAMSIINVNFPSAAPKEYSRAPVFMPVRIPPPLGNPNGGAKPQTQQAAPKPAPVQQQAQITAPSQVPETITPVESTGAGEATTTGTGTVPGPVGVPWGVKDSIGDLDAPPAIVDVPVQPEPETKVYQPHEVQAPVLLRKVDPRYPQHLTRVGMGATVVVRCIIGKDGSVREPQVIVPSMPPFNAAVLDALPQWRYKPATHNGKPVDSYLNLTVTFNVQRYGMVGRRREAALRITAPAPPDTRTAARFRTPVR